MTLSEQQIIYLIKNPKNKRIIDRAIEIKRKHELHITGNKHELNAFIDRIDGIENKDVEKLKRKLAIPFTKPVYEEVLRPVDKIFSAKGGSKFYDLTDSQKRDLIKLLKGDLSKGGYNLNEYLQNIWALWGIFIDPLSLSFYETYLDDDNQERLLLTYKSVYDRDCKGHITVNYHDIDYDSIDNIYYIIFNYTITGKGNKIYRIIDSEKDILVIEYKDEQDDNRKYRILKYKINFETEDIILNENGEPIENIYDNKFGKVPGVINSSRNDKINKKSKTTYVSDTIDLADDLLNDYIDFRIIKKKVGIPKIWEVPQVCSTCKGSKKVEHFKNGDQMIYVDCVSCKGTGYQKERNLSDIIQLNVTDPELMKILIPPAGSVTIPIEIQQNAFNEIKEYILSIYNIVWGNGSFIDSSKRNTTAYEISVKQENQLAKLGLISENKAIVEKGLTDLAIIFLFGQNKGQSIINPPTDFQIKTDNQLYNEYLESKDKASEGQRTRQYREYLQVKYKNNLNEFDRQLAIFLLEPYPHNTLKETTDLNITNIEFQIKKKYQVYLQELMKIEMISIENLDKLKEQLIILATKDLKNDTSD